MLNNIPETATTIWKFVHNLNIIDFNNKVLSDDDATAIHEIMQAADSLINMKPEIYNFLNK